MQHALSFPAALLLVVTFGASGQLTAQGTVKLPAGAQPATVVKSTIQRPTVSQVPPGSLSPTGTAPFAQSLTVSMDGVHWGRSATVSYTNTCTHGPPSSCGITPPYFPMSLHWNPPAASDHMVQSSSIGYYLIDFTVDPTCWDPRKISYVQGDQNATHWSGEGPSPNASQSYTCTYHIGAQTLVNGTPGTIRTNDVTVYVNIVPATH